MARGNFGGSNGYVFEFDGGIGGFIGTFVSPHSLRSIHQICIAFYMSIIPH